MSPEPTSPEPTSPEPTSREEAEGEISLARVALAEDDLRHAATHLAGAIALAPDLPEAHELLSEIAARSADGGLSLFPVNEEQSHVGTVVAHAHLLAPTEPGQALWLLAQATRFDGLKPWADVLWVRTLDATRVDADRLVKVFVAVMNGLGREPVAEPRRAANAAYLDLATRAVLGHPDHALVHGTAAGVARRLKAVAQALAWGERAWRLERTKFTSVWYAYALKADGRLEDALSVMRDARERDPLDLDLCADMANWLAEADRLDEALALLDDALRTDPTYDCAVHTAQRLRFQHDGDARHLIALADFMREHPVASHTHTDLDDSCQARPWLGMVAGPTEACINVLAKTDATSKLVSLALSGLEVPSALAVARRAAPGIEITVTEPLPSDMLAPLRPGRALWRYDGAIAYPTVEPAAPSSAELLAQIATLSWAHPVAAYEQAGPLGQVPVEELLSLLIHPPARPPRIEPQPAGWWERAAQTYACLGILHAADVPGGPRALLTEIAYGVEDWTTETALFALTVAAWVDPECRTEVCAVVGERFLDAVVAARTRAVTVLDSLAELVLIVPGMVDDVIAIAQRVRTSE